MSDALPKQVPGDSIRVKFLGKACREHNRDSWLGRFPNSQPCWGRCEFIFDSNARHYDWLVVYDDLPTDPGRDFEPLACPRSRTLLITAEPSSIKVYSPYYTRQFGWVLTSQEPWAIRHPHVIRRQPGLIWYYGATGHGDAVISERGRYDSIIRNLPLQKTRTIATVCSTKQQRHTLHYQRVRFVQQLKAAMPELDVFGHGWNYLPNKADALDSYRFHLAIENHVAPHHWTEKLADAFLGVCLPFYHGCPNYADYFPEESVIPIDIFDFERSFEIIQRAIRDREDEKRRSAVLESRRLYLERYWLFAQLAQLIEERHWTMSVIPEHEGIIAGRRRVRKSSCRAMIGELILKIRNRAYTLWTRFAHAVRRGKQTGRDAQ
ncbi:MAG: glycosyltransferase family 10 [Verrucomicrobiota bacterium]|nr:glycosyltransferase family 10 [Verrucomicrobiota bacterium]